MAKEEGTASGSGFQSPFGNEKGGTMASGPSTGAHNFIKNPGSSAASESGGRNFLEEKFTQASRDDEEITGSVPEGGELPFPNADPSKQEQAREDNPGVAEKAPLPFKNLR